MLIGKKVFINKKAMTIEFTVKLLLALILLLVLLGYLGFRYWDSISDTITSIFGFL